jgi:hypothetical protein
MYMDSSVDLTVFQSEGASLSNSGREECMLSPAGSRTCEQLICNRGTCSNGIAVGRSAHSAKLFRNKDLVCACVKRTGAATSAGRRRHEPRRSDSRAAVPVFSAHDAVTVVTVSKHMKSSPVGSDGPTASVRSHVRRMPARTDICKENEYTV